MVAWMDRWCLRHANVIHVTSEMEQEWTTTFLGERVKEKIRVIPNGIYIPSNHRECRAEYHGEIKKKVLYLGRLHPLKGLDLLVQAWRNMEAQNDFDQWELHVVGPDEQGTLTQLQKTRLKKIRFIGSVQGNKKWTLLEGTDVVVLPSRSENFGIVVGEALSCGVPVVVTKGAPWEKIEEVGCGYWVDVSVEGITDGLSRMMRLTDEQRREMGAKGKAWVSQEFAWKRVASEMLNAYRGILA